MSAFGPSAGAPGRRRPPLLAELTQCAAFESVDESVLAPTTRDWSSRRLERGDVLWPERGHTTCVHVLVEGHLKLTKSTTDAREIIVGLAGPGQLIFAATSLSSLPMPVAAVALDDVRLLSIHRERFRSVVRSSRCLFDSLLRVEANQVASVAARAAEFATFSAEKRLALFFLQLAEAEGRRVRAEDGSMEVFIEIQLSRRDVAGLINTRTETAIRLMSRWHREDVLHTKEGGFSTADLSRVRAIATAE